MIDTCTARDHGTTAAAAAKGRPEEPTPGPTQTSHDRALEPVGIYLRPQWWRSRAAAAGMAAAVATLLMLAVYLLGTA